MSNGKRYTIGHFPYNSRKLFQGMHSHKLLHIVRIMRHTWNDAIVTVLKTKELLRIFMVRIF